MKKYSCIIVISFYIACAPAIKMDLQRDFYSGGQDAVNPAMGIVEPDSFLIGSGLNPYLQGYNDGMMMAKNESFGGCLVGGCFIGAAGIVGGYYAPRLFDKFPSTTITVLSIVGGIAASIGSIYLANRITNVNVPDPMVEDTLYRKGFIEGYRVSLKSRRLNESLKGTAIGVGTTFAGAALGYVLLIWMVIQILGSLPM